MRRLHTSACVTLLSFLATGCASLGGKTSGDAENVAASEHAELYDGAPEVVFATEFPVASVEEALARAEAALAEGEIDLALYMYVRAYDLDNENVYALYRIGKIHEARGNARMAKMALGKVLSLNPEHPGALEALGLLYLREKAQEEALVLLQRAVVQEPALWRAQNGIGVILDMQGDHELAVEAFDAALEVNPGDASLLNNRGYSLYLSGKYEQAAKDFAAAADAGVERAWLNLGLVLARQEKYPQAVQMMAKVVDIEVAYNDVGYIAMRQGHNDLAKVYFEKAIHVSPRYFRAAERNLVELIEQESDPSSSDVPPSPIADVRDGGDYDGVETGGQ